MNDYTDATTCECGALIECLDSGQGYSYWVHVKRMRIQYDHAAVPVRPVAPFDPTPEDLANARSDFAAATRNYTDSFIDRYAEAMVLGMVQASLTGAAETSDANYADSRIREARAYLVVLAEFRERGAR